MSDPGYSSFQPPPKPEIPLWTLLTAGAFAVVGAILLTYVVLGELQDDEEKTNYPAAWDERVAPYVKIVEEQRGLNFLHPVAVRFLDKAAFTKEVTRDEKELKKDERAEIERATQQLRAIGLLSGDVDLFAAVNDATGGGTLAFYSFETESITIRGKALTSAVKPTLVHELTHALQDQHFAIGDRREALREKDSADTEEGVLDAIIEGDAERVATLYRESLTAKQRAALAKAEKAQQDQAENDLKGVPKAILTIIGSPYTLGQSLTQTVAESGGNTAVDALYRDTPTHDAALYNPFQVLAGDLTAKKVDTPKTKDGEKEFDSGEFGALSWYFMLAQRLPLLQAVDAVDGWGGDSSISFERQGVTCIRTAYRGDDDAATQLMLNAVRSWIAKAPGTPASVSLNNGVMTFESCDPGKSAKVANDASIDALTLIGVRNQIGAELLGAGAPENVAGCVAGRIVQEYTVAQLTDPKFGAGNTAVIRKIQQFALECR